MKVKLGQIINFLDKSSMVFSFMWLTGALPFLTLEITGAVAYLTTFLFLLIYWKKAIWTFVQEKLFWLYIGLIIISLSWSVDFGTSFYSTFKLIGTLLIGFSLVVRFNPKEQLQILAWVLGIGVFLSLFYVLALPEQGIMGGSLQGAWSGVYKHKNGLGNRMVISTMVFFLLSIEASRYRWLLYSLLALSFALLILSTSKTSLVVVFTLLALFPLYRALRWSYSWLIPFFSIFIITISICALLLVSQLEKIFIALGKDATLTGRVPLWELVIEKIRERPWLGYGYDAFWSRESADFFLKLDGNWEAANSHNGLLDLWLAFGLLGVVIATLAFFKIFLRSVAYIRSTKSAFAFWPLWYLTFMFLSNITESSMNSFSISWALNTSVALSTHRKIINHL